MGEVDKAPLARSVEYLTDWSRLEKMLAEARGKSVSQPPPEESVSSRPAPTLEELGRVVDLEKLKTMFSERKAAATPSPQAKINPAHPAAEVRTPSTKPGEAAAAHRSRRNEHLSRWALDAASFCAASMMAGSASPVARTAVMGGLVAASVSLMRRYGQEEAASSLGSALESVSESSASAAPPSDFRQAIEEKSPHARSLFSLLDKASSSSRLKPSPPGGSTAGEIAESIEKHAVEKAQSRASAFLGMTFPRLQRPTTGLEVERGMRRESGERGCGMRGL